MSNETALNIYLESGGAPWPHVQVRSLSGRETISQLFSFAIEVVCEEAEKLPDQAYPGAEVSVVIEHFGEEVRRVHGVVGAIQDRLEATGKHRSYRLQMRPRASQLTLVETQAVFVDMTFPQAIQQKLEMHGFGASDFELRLQETYPVREFVVQFGETDLAFVSRLAEHMGISFFFEHDGGKDKLVFTDQKSGFRPIATDGAEEVAFRSRGEGTGVFAIDLVLDAVPGLYVVQDYNYRMPNLDVTGEFELAANGGGGGGVVEYGANAKTPDEAAFFARVRAEERAATSHIYHGKSGHPALSAGRRFALMDHPRLSTREELFVVEVEHEAFIPVFDARGKSPSYENSFSAIPASVPYRPPRTTPRPTMPAVVTGVVQPGPNGEVGGVARLDNQGRYAVALHFDPARNERQKASHPIRMAQPFAGQGNAMHFPLLPGTEVVVGFANGDPDRPIILGALPNTVSPAAIVDREARTHRIQTAKGLIIQFGSIGRKGLSS
jgi:type VI secretion system secreted protein VgrG